MKASVSSEILSAHGIFLWPQTKEEHQRYRKISQPLIRILRAREGVMHSIDTHLDQWFNLPHDELGRPTIAISRQSELALDRTLTSFTVTPKLEKRLNDQFVRGLAVSMLHPTVVLKGEVRIDIDGETAMSHQQSTLSLIRGGSEEDITIFSNLANELYQFVDARVQKL